MRRRTGIRCAGEGEGTAGSPWRSLHGRVGDIDHAPMEEVMPVNKKTLYMELLRLQARMDPLDQVLEPISDAIHAAGDRADRAEASDAWADAVIDDECDLVENLLGAAFIACQTFITAVVSAAMRLHEYCIKENLPVSGSLAKKATLLGLGAPVGGLGVTDVELLDALANYYKHRSEWRGSDWANPRRRQAATIAVIKRAGLEARSTGNLRTGAGILGNPGYDDLYVFHNLLRAWASRVLEAAA